MDYPNYRTNQYGGQDPVHRVEIDLNEHNARHAHKEHNMGVDDKVEVKNIFQPGGGHGGGDGVGGLGAMAAIAALGNRNGGNDSGWGHRGGYGDGAGLGLGAGLGGGLLGGILAGALFGRGGFGGGFGGGNGGGEAVAVTADINQSIFGTAVLTKLGSIEAAVPIAALNTQNSILEQTNALSTQLGQQTLATTIGFSNTKDAVQNTAAALAVGISNVNQNVSSTGCMIERALAADGDRTRALVQSIFQTQQTEKITGLEIALARATERAASDRQHDELKLSITNNNTAVAAQQQGQLQAQQQAQFQTLAAGIGSLNGLLGQVFQVAHATNTNVIAGNSGAVVTGPQTANPTNVNA